MSDKMADADSLFDKMFNKSKQENSVETKIEEKNETIPINPPIEPIPEKVPEKVPEPKKPLDLFNESVKPTEKIPAEESTDLFSAIKPEIVHTTKSEITSVQTPNIESEQMSNWNIGNNFNLDEEEVSGKQITTIYGLKGNGKTSLAFSFPGTIACLSFDHKSAMIKANMFDNDKRIKVYNAIKYQNESSPAQTLESSEITFKYVSYLLSELNKAKPDWIVIDGIEVLQQICEMVMRSRNNIMPYQGIANPNIWKERRLYIRQVHRQAVEACKMGVIYTTYTDKDELIENGTLLTKKTIPKWVDAIMTETDDVIHIEASSDKNGGRKFVATVESSKTGLPTGKSFDVTDSGISVIWAEKKVKK
jgi:hypothetical protein